MLDSRVSSLGASDDAVIEEKIMPMLIEIFDKNKIQRKIVVGKRN